eukprot:Nk52_evm1s2608 gene=Nk52_evmTU1s2608
MDEYYSNPKLNQSQNEYSEPNQWPSSNAESEYQNYPFTAGSTASASEYEDATAIIHNGGVPLTLNESHISNQMPHKGSANSFPNSSGRFSKALSSSQPSLVLPFSSQPTSADSEIPEDLKEPSKKRKRNIIIISIIVSALLVGAVVGVVVWQLGGSSGGHSSSTPNDASGTKSTTTTTTATMGTTTSTTTRAPTTTSSTSSWTPTTTTTSSTSSWTPTTTTTSSTSSWTPTTTTTSGPTSTDLSGPVMYDFEWSNGANDKVYYYSLKHLVGEYLPHSAPLPWNIRPEASSGTKSIDIYVQDAFQHTENYSPTGPAYSVCVNEAGSPAACDWPEQGHDYNYTVRAVPYSDYDSRGTRGKGLVLVFSIPATNSFFIKDVYEEYLIN